MTNRHYAGIWYSKPGLGAATPVELVAAPTAGYENRVLKAIVMVDTANAGDKAEINDTASFVFGKFGAGVEGTQEVDCTDQAGGSANQAAANKKIQVAFTGTTARYTIKVLVAKIKTPA